MVKSAYIRAFGETATMPLCFTKLSGLWRTTGFGQEHTTMYEFPLFGHIWSLSHSIRSACHVKVATSGAQYANSCQHWA